MNWLQQQAANILGTAEPVYGRDGIRPVTDQAALQPFTELRKQDMKWLTPDSTCVETHTFYAHAENGTLALLQIIYSNVAGIRITCQFNAKLYFPDERPNLWTSDPLSNHGFDKDRYSFLADNCSVELSEDGNTYHIKSTRNQKNKVDVKFTKAAPSFVVGKDGTSYFGPDPEKPWGSMMHAFWPRCKTEGTCVTAEGTIDMKGTGLFIHALQGMKPHHAAARWNFADFVSPEYSAVLMEFTTPPSYGSTKVTIGSIARDGKLLFAGPCPAVIHDSVKGDSEVDWPEPSEITFRWQGKGADGDEVSASISGQIGDRIDRIDVMAEVPGFVKQIVANAAGTRPYIYQYRPKVQFKIKSGNEESVAVGDMFSEATFIS